LWKILPSLGFDPWNWLWVGTLKDDIEEEDLEAAGKSEEAEIMVETWREAKTIAVNRCS